MRTGINLESAHRHNLRVVFESIRAFDAISTSELVKQTGLTAQSISNILRKLEEGEYLSRSVSRANTRGQPAHLVSIRPEAMNSLGVHLERDRFTVVLLNLAGEIVTRTESLLTDTSPDTVIRDMATALTQVTQSIEAAGGAPPRGIGLALPGPVIVEEGRVRSVPNFPGWDNVPVRDSLKERVNIPVYIENDGTAAAMGELWSGGGRRSGSFFYVYFGGNLGGGLIVDGVPWRGASGNAGDFGRLMSCRSDANARACHVNDVASLGALRKRLPGMKLRDMADAFQRGTPEFMAWLHDAVDALIHPLAAVENLFDPEKIIFGGIFPQAVLDHMREETDRRLARLRMPGRSRNPRMETGEIERDAAAFGAAVLPVYDILAPANRGFLSRGEYREKVKKQIAFS